MDDTLWPISLKQFQGLNEHLADNLPKVHAGHQWQNIINYYREIVRELEEWKRLERLEREAMEAYEHCMAM